MIEYSKNLDGWAAHCWWIIYQSKDSQRLEQCRGILISHLSINRAAQEVLVELDWSVMDDDCSSAKS
jgi:hypothetical protein